MLVADKVALVTGSSRGIGRAIAIEMAREGADVVINYSLSKDKASEVARGVESLDRKALVLKADVSKPAGRGHAVIRTLPKTQATEPENMPLLLESG